DEDAAHGLGSSGEEVTPAVPVARLATADEPEVGLVDEGGWLKRLARLLVREALRSELAQLVVDEWQQLGGGLGIAGLNGGHELREFGHAAQHTLTESASRPEIGHRSSLWHRTLTQHRNPLVLLPRLAVRSHRPLPSHRPTGSWVLTLLAAWISGR